MPNRYALLVVPALGTLLIGQAASPTRATIDDRVSNPQVHVYVATLQPHKPSPSASGHPTNRVLLYMDDGVMTRKEGSGPAETITFHRGDVRWRAASGPYVAENTSDHPIRILEVDLLGKPSGVSTATKLDPVAVDPNHYKVVFENEFVRVLRVHFGPREKGEQHEHILNRVVWYLNEQAGAHPDDVRMAGAAVHSEQNQLDTPAERVAVELK